MLNTLYEKHKISSFDRNYSTEIYLKYPDKYRQLETETLNAESLITRGSGYSYSAASFKKESLSLGMKNFNRILNFNKKEKLIQVESGITILELLNFTLKSNLWISQIPGYPFISIGGAVASNVHGKSGGWAGTIRNAIKEILIFHKEHGWITLSDSKNKNIFDLTIGGYGLTGTIVNVTLKLIDFSGYNFKTTIQKTKSITETADFIKSNDRENSLVYSWNRSNTNAGNFGDGLIFCNSVNTNNKTKNFNINNFKKSIFFNKVINFCVWNKMSIKFFNYIFYNYYSLFKKNNYNDNFNNVIFPFLGKEIYFSFFGKKGFFESQILIPYEKVDIFIDDLKNIINIYEPTITLFSVKGMSGEHKYLRFEGNMICITLNIANNKKNSKFMNELDKLYIKHGAIPSIIKDSRIQKEVFNKCYKFADEFRKELRNFDRKRIYKSELSDRLEL